MCIVFSGGILHGLTLLFVFIVVFILIICLVDY